MLQAVTHLQKQLGQCIQTALYALLLFASIADAAEFSLNIADIAAPDFTARGIVLILPENGSADLRIAELHVQQRGLRNVHLHCASFALSTASMNCHGGSLAQLPGMSLEFDYRFDTGKWQVSAALRNVPGKQFAAFLPASMLLPTQGRLSGTLRISGEASGVAAVAADMQLADAGFSDASGLHAAEKLRGTVKFAAVRKAALWTWQGNIAWQSGEIFWQPLYLRGGHRISASGSFDGARLKVEQAIVDLPEVGRVQFAALWDMKQSTLAECTAHGENLALEKFFADYARPFLDKGALAESHLYGHADADWQYRNGATQSLRLALRDAGIADAEQRFALLGVNSEIDWQADAPRTANIAFAGGALLGVPLGSGQWAVQMRGMEFSVAQGVLPVLDGKIELHDFNLHHEAGYRETGQAGKPCSGCSQDVAWHWQFAASLSRISMEQFSQAAGWPKMLGTLAGRIPKVSYDGHEIDVDGALLFNVFDGTVVATQLKLADPFGRAPRLSGSLTMRELDLDLLTRTFSFGNMQGRIDVDVNNLELQDWQPARFDARVFSSAGDYPKKISQKAVQNISALGGAGAVAAIQRSYLSFFKDFGYERIGWSCALRNGVCAMGGVDDGNGGAYVIVKGGGIPAITVMGYNRSVSWDELITRLKRVTQNNMQAVVK
ncbi:MAG: hypothetical protein PHG89_11450 [Gallionella sp.]|nr:hypothetical protein [Gallionella sp.]